jgi:hypothetical protein
VFCNVWNESKDQEIARLTNLVNFHSTKNSRKKLLSIAMRSSVTPGRQLTSVTPAPLSKRDKAMSATTESLPAESKSPKKKKAKTMSHQATCNAQPELAASAMPDNDEITMNVGDHAVKFGTTVGDSISHVPTQDGFQGEQATSTQSEGTGTNSIVLSDRASVSAMP